MTDQQEILEEEQELNELLQKANKTVKGGLVRDEDRGCYGKDLAEDVTEEPHRRDKPYGKLQQWATSDGNTFTATATCVKKLKPGLYTPILDNHGNVHFQSGECSTEDVLTFPDGVSERVLDNIKTFWDREEIYNKNGLTFKRGFLLWGPPGSGKTSTIRLIMKDVIERGGVIMKFEHPGVFSAASKVFRIIQPDTPVVVILEDLDAILERFSESDVINILDGVDVINKVVFVATTNYPEKLGERVINRPSRFDRRYKVGEPNAECREIYFKHLFDKSPTDNWEDHDLDRWIEDTHGMSLAHLKELFVGVIVLGDEYDMVISKLKNMSSHLSSGDYQDEGEATATGFALGDYKTVKAYGA
jgi:predicted AAA+ superfamily ATPase